MSPQCSAVSASSAGGAGGVPNPSLSLTQTPMHHSIMDALHWCQREAEAEQERERERDGERTKERHGGGWWWRKKGTAIRRKEKGAEGNVSEIKAAAWRQGSRQKEQNLHQAIPQIKRGNRRDSLGPI